MTIFGLLISAGRSSSRTAFTEQPHVSDSLSTTDLLTQAEPLRKKSGYEQNILPSTGFVLVTPADNPARFEDQYQDLCAVFLNRVVSRLSANDNEEEARRIALYSFSITPLFQETQATMSSGLLSKDLIVVIALSAVRDLYNKSSPGISQQ